MSNPGKKNRIKYQYNENNFGFLSKIMTSTLGFVYKKNRERNKNRVRVFYSYSFLYNINTFNNYFRSNFLNGIRPDRFIASWILR